MFRQIYILVGRKIDKFTIKHPLINFPQANRDLEENRVSQSDVPKGTREKHKRQHGVTLSCECMSVCAFLCAMRKDGWISIDVLSILLRTLSTYVASVRLVLLTTVGDY